MKNYKFTIIAIIVSTFTGCAEIQNVSHRDTLNELVMFDGMEIKVRNNYGMLVIYAEKPFKRYYTWEGETRSVEMIPRKKRWYGKFGIYFPGKGNHWKEHNGITRGVLEEAQLHFATTKNAMKFLTHPSRINSTVYRDDGLAVTWSKSIKPDRSLGGTLFVDVWQVYIEGKKPEKLPGSENDKVIVTNVRKLKSK